MDQPAERLAAVMILWEDRIAAIDLQQVVGTVLLHRESGLELVGLQLVLAAALDAGFDFEG